MKKLTALLLALILLASLSACKKAETKPAEPMRIMTLNGTTGFGMAGLIVENAASEKPKDVLVNGPKESYVLNGRTFAEYKPWDYEEETGN